MVPEDLERLLVVSRLPEEQLGELAREKLEQFRLLEALAVLLAAGVFELAEDILVLGDTLLDAVKRCDRPSRNGLDLAPEGLEADASALVNVPAAARRLGHSLCSRP